MASRATANAIATWPFRLSATPTTATSAMLGWEAMLSSISRSGAAELAKAADEDTLGTGDPADLVGLGKESGDIELSVEPDSNIDAGEIFRSTQAKEQEKLTENQLPPVFVSKVIAIIDGFILSVKSTIGTVPMFSP
jgi:hypothetical protein